MVEQSLKDKTVKGVAWSGIDNVAQFGISFIIGIILARLLSPEDYGLLGLIGIFTAVCGTLINGGFGIALIRKKEILEEDYNTVFIINMVMSILLYVIIYVCSPLIANFFGRVELVDLTRVSCLEMIIGAFSFVQGRRLTKKIDFKSQTKITIVSVIFSGLVGIVMAYNHFGVWSLVAQRLSSQTIRTVLLCYFNKWLPRLRFSVQSFKELFGFGWKLLLSGLLDTVWKELYQLIVGKFYSPATLGQYTRAKGFSQIFSSNLTSVIERVTLPSLSYLQDDKVRLRSAFQRIAKISMFMTVPLMLMVGAVSHSLLYCLIGPQWDEAAIYLPLICLNGTLYPIHSLNLAILHIQGRSDIFLYTEILKKVLLLCPLFVGVFVGIMPMLYVNLIVGIIAFFINAYYTGKFLAYSPWSQIKDISQSYFMAFGICIPVWLFNLTTISYWIMLPLQLLTGTVLFFVGCKMFRFEEYAELKNIIVPYVKNRLK